MEVGNEFKDIYGYNAEMAKVMNDKLFFTEMFNDADIDLVVDFGCADGTMIEQMYMRGFGHNNTTYIGYDISEQMIDLARTKFPFQLDHGTVIFTTNWDTVKQYVESKCNPFSTDEQRSKDWKGKSVLILSSVIHEVYSYGTDDDVKEFWERVTETGFDYIVIRDMGYTPDIERPTTELALREVMNDKLYGKGSFLLKEFEDRWGSIKENKNLVHYLLKHKWLVNWKREVNENYLPVSINDIFAIFRMQGEYNPMYYMRFSPLRNAVIERFNFNMRDDTHFKLVMQRNIRKR